MKSTIIRQPGYLPNVGFFKKIESCDIFVLFDDAQYAIRAWDNRNKIKTKDGGSSWITVPVISPYKKNLNQVKISYDKNWQKTHKGLIKKNYLESPFFKDYWEDISDILDTHWDYLIDLNLKIINYVISSIGLKTKIVRSSEMKITSQRSQRLLGICKNLNVDCYISGINGKEYLEKDIFDREGIQVMYENFQHPVYKQINGNFIKNMSIIDLLFNEGENAKNIIINSKNL
jgi:hypothetical protein